MARYVRDVDFDNVLKYVPSPAGVPEADQASFSKCGNRRLEKNRRTFSSAVWLSFNTVVKPNATSLDLTE